MSQSHCGHSHHHPLNPDLTTSKEPLSPVCFLHQTISRSVKDRFRVMGRKLSGQELSYVAKTEYCVPDSKACLAALSMVADCSPPFLVNHSLRSYAFGVAMSHRVKRPFDKEVLFMGSVMHDLGLIEEHDHGGTFECDGAISAHSFALEQGVSVEKADLIHEMVALHNSVGVADKKEPEVALLHYGAGLDVAALFDYDINPQTLTEIIMEYPRLDMAEGFIALLKDQLRRKPNSYMKTLIDMGFYKMIRNVNF